MNCFINIDKPAGITSADAVFRLKKLLFPKFGSFKIGHAGTLDPMATGVLPMACGAATRALPFIPDDEKAYVFDITFGRSTTTDDAEGETLATTETVPTVGEIEGVLPRFAGEIMQAPPAYSAIRVDGMRAYALARKGVAVELEPRPRHVRKLGLVKKISRTEYRFEVAADRGFYVRSLARDVAMALGSLGYVSFLRRTKSGPFEIGDSITLDKLASVLDNCARLQDARAFGFCLDISRGLDGIPVVDMDEGREKSLRNGRSVPCPAGDFPLVQIRCHGVLVAIAKPEKGALRPIRVFDLE